MPPKTNRQTRYWWVSASDKNPGHRWHWKEFFQNPGDPRQRYDWGGPDWIRSYSSFARIREMRKGHVVVAYQAGEGVLGLAYLASNGYPHIPKGNYDSFNLKPSPTVWLTRPVPYQMIRELPNARENFEFVRAAIKRGTVFRIKPDGFHGLIKHILALNPEQAEQIRRFSPLGRSPLEAEIVAVDEPGQLKSTHKAILTVQRVVRDSTVGKGLKQLYQWECQVCGQTIELPGGKRYAEVHHLRPVGKPHNGKDGTPNTIVVCPQHHAMFDLGVIAVNPITHIVEHWNPKSKEHGSELILMHGFDRESLEYHYRKIFNRSQKMRQGKNQ